MFKKIIVWFIPIIVSLFVTGCGGAGEDPILGQSVSETSLAPTVVAVTPLNNELNVSYNIQSITAEFNVPMNPATLASSFTLSKSSTPNVLVGGTVSYDNRVAELTLNANLSQDTNYTATITTVAKSADGVALSTNYVWRFTTGSDTAIDITPPTVLSTSPRNGELNVSITKIITATFSEAMKSLSITTPGTFTVKKTGTTNNINGTVSYSVINKIASFKPAALIADTNYTATITTAAKDLAGNAMEISKIWTFKTAAESINPPAPLVALGLASTYGIASTAGITNKGATHIEGDAVFNPTATCNGIQILAAAAGTFGACNGFAPTINGTVVTPVYPVPSPAQDVTDDLRAAYLSITPANMPGGAPIAAGTTLGAPTGTAMVKGDNLFTTGVYTSNTSILITGDLTLDAQNNPNATFVFQSASSIGTSTGARILLVNGAKASNVYWQAGSDVTLKAGTSWNGNILAYRSITMVTGASSCGRLFAGAFTDGAFVFDSNNVSVPGKPYALGTCE